MPRPGRPDDEARAALDAWVAVQHRPKPNEPVLRRRVEGLLRAARGDEAAAAELDAARAEAEALNLVLEALWTELDVAAALVPSDRRQAADVLRNAAARSADLGARTLQGLAEQRLRALGVRTWRRGAAAADAGAHPTPDRARAGGGAAGGCRRDQPGDRGRAVPLAQDRGAPRLQRAREAGRTEPRRAGRAGRCGDIADSGGVPTEGAPR